MNAQKYTKNVTPPMLQDGSLFRVREVEQEGSVALLRLRWEHIHGATQTFCHSEHFHK